MAEDEKDAFLQALNGSEGPVGGTNESDYVRPELAEPERADGSVPGSLAAPLAPALVSWMPLVKKLGINLLIPFLNGVMLGFGEIFAHELGVLLGWRQAKGFDPSSMPAATNPRARRRWLFGLY